MKPKLLLCLALILGASLFGCYLAWQHLVQSFLGSAKTEEKMESVSLLC
jgi:hypothetical protein